MRRSTRTAIDRAHRALQILAERLDEEPAGDDLQRQVADINQQLHDAETEYWRERAAA